MTPDAFERFRQGTLLRQELAMSGDILWLTEWRRDKVTGLVLKATYTAESLLTWAQGRRK